MRGRLVKGYRKIVAFSAAAVSLLAGMWIAQRVAEIGVGLYGIFAPALTTALGVFTYGNSQEHKHAKPDGPPAAP